jgi:hypothetical protein
VVKRAGRAVARLRVTKSGPFAIAVAQGPGRAAYRVRFVPRAGSGLSAAAKRVRVKRA